MDEFHAGEELKSTASIDAGHFRGLKVLAASAGERFVGAHIIAGEELIKFFNSVPAARPFQSAQVFRVADPEILKGRKQLSADGVCKSDFSSDVPAAEGSYVEAVCALRKPRLLVRTDRAVRKVFA